MRSFSPASNQEKEKVFKNIAMGSKKRSQYLNLLQILGLCAVIAFHVGTPFSDAGWIAVELFFVIAGINMAGAVDREQSVLAFAGSRIKRMAPELCVAWGGAVLLVIAGYSTGGIWWFVATGPFFGQNLTLLSFDYSFPRDWVIGPLWFVGALLQLQCFVFALKSLWMRARPAAVVLASLCFGVAFRFVAGLVLADETGMLSSFRGDVLYCLPFSHIEAITFGVLAGRGAFPKVGRFVALFAGLALAAGAVNLWLSDGQIGPRSLGFAFPLHLNYSHVWGYPILALAAVSICARNGSLAVALSQVRRPAWLHNGLVRLAPLGYGAYVFHGVIMAAGINGSRSLLYWDGGVPRMLLFGITLVESFALAWIVAWLVRRPIPSLLRTAGFLPDSPKLSE